MNEGRAGGRARGWAGGRAGGPAGGRVLLVLLLTSWENDGKRGIHLI